MALADLIHAGVATAKSILDTGKLLVTVYHHPWTGQNEYGEPTFGPRVARKALVDSTMLATTTNTGTADEAQVKMTFLEDFSLDMRDHFDCPCPHGPHLENQPIVHIHRGVVDRALASCVLEVYL